MISARLRLRVSLLGLCAASVASALPARADGLVIPGIGPSDNGYPRPSYRQAYNAYPTPAHDIFGQPVASPPIDARPTNRQSNNDFPPAGGRYGGGFIEYVMTGGRPEPLAPRAYAPQPYAPQAYAQPVYAAPAHEVYVNRAGLAHGGLPDYAPGSPVYYGQPGFAAQVAAPVAYAQVGYGQAGYGQQASYDPAAAESATVPGQINPIYYRQEVEYTGRERAGTIIIDTPEKFLYLVQPGGRALRYGIGVGRPGFTWGGVKTISRKAEWPAWTPPAEMIARRPDLPRHMAGGEGNPLGARAMYLGSSLYRIHGTTEPHTIGTNVSSGCIRMMNQDVIDLYGRVGVGTRVVVL